jgi:hypothetical protein
MAASTQRHGMRSFSKAMPCELGVQNRSRGAYQITRRTVAAWPGLRRVPVRSPVAAIPDL